MGIVSKSVRGKSPGTWHKVFDQMSRRSEDRGRSYAEHRDEHDRSVRKHGDRRERSRDRSPDRSSRKQTRTEHSDDDRDRKHKKDKRSHRDSDDDSRRKKRQSSSKHHRKEHKEKKEGRNRDDRRTAFEVSNPISIDDFFAKNQEFRCYLRLVLNKNFEDLTTEDAQKSFEKHFIREYNAGRLDEMYYTGDLPLEVRKLTGHSQHKWNFKLSTRDQEVLRDLTEDIDAQSHSTNKDLLAHDNPQTQKSYRE